MLHLNLYIRLGGHKVAYNLFVHKYCTSLICLSVRHKYTVQAQLVANCQCLIQCLLGAHEFFSDLTRHLKKLPNANGQTIPLSVEFVKVKSYENTSSTGNVKISLTEEEMQAWKGKDLLIVEDIVDTGATSILIRLS